MSKLKFGCCSVQCGVSGGVAGSVFFVHAGGWLEPVVVQKAGALGRGGGGGI